MKKNTGLLLGGAAALGLLYVMSKDKGQAAPGGPPVPTAEPYLQIGRFYQAGKITDYTTYTALYQYFVGRYDLSTEEQKAAMRAWVTELYQDGVITDHPTYVAIYTMVG